MDSARQVATRDSQAGCAALRRVTPYLSDPVRQDARMMNRIACEPVELLVATFGRGQLVRTANGRYEMRGGTLSDLLEAREWTSLFLPEATLNAQSHRRR